MNKIQIRKIMTYLKRIPTGYLLVFLGYGILIMGIHFLGYLTPLLQKETIDQAIQIKSLFNPFFFYLLFSYLGFFILSALTRVIGIHNHINISRSLFFDTWQRIILQKKDIIANKGKGYYFNILSDDLNNITNLFNEGVFNFIFSTLQSILILGIVFVWSRILFTGLLVLYGITIGLTIGVTYWRKKYLPLLRESSGVFANETVDSLANTFTIKAFIKIEKIRKLMQYKFDRAYSFVRKTININNVGALSISGAETAGFLFLILFSLFLIIKGELTYGTLIALISYFKILFTPIENFFSFLTLISSAEISIERLNTIQDQEITRTTGYQNQQLLWDKFRKLEFKDINFSFNDEQSQNISSSDQTRGIQQVAFTLENKDRIGIVGLSGEGKSTILKMLYRELQPQQGQILINNTNIYHLPLLFYYYNINILTQEAEIFNKDLIFNLTCGKEIILQSQVSLVKQRIREELTIFINQLEHVFTEYEKDKNKLYIHVKKIIKKFRHYGELLKVLAITTADRLLNEKDGKSIQSYLLYIKYLVMQKEALIVKAVDMEFYNNYVTRERLDEILKKLEIEKLLGRELGESGAFLSGGEKRRILLGRFLLREDYGFFIIDEAFSSLDAINEGKLLQIIRTEINNKPGIVISHKFNVLLQLTNRMLVVNNGKTIQSGQHEELLGQGGIYTELYQNFLAQRERVNQQ